MLAIISSLAASCKRGSVSTFLCARKASSTCALTSSLGRSLEASLARLGGWPLTRVAYLSYGRVFGQPGCDPLQELAHGTGSLRLAAQLGGDVSVAPADRAKRCQPRFRSLGSAILLSSMRVLERCTSAEESRRLTRAQSPRQPVGTVCCGRRR